MFGLRRFTFKRKKLVLFFRKRYLKTYVNVMTHSLDFVGLSQKLFFLRHLVAGNKEFCRREQLYVSTKNFPSEDWDNHSERMRYLVSNDLIECAAKMRVILDTTASEVEPGYLQELDTLYVSQKGIGSVLVGNFALTIRESCNKIIHATNFELVSQNARNTQPRYLYSYWNGVCRLDGTHAKKPWRVALDVYRWADAMDSFLHDLSQNVDW